MSNAGENTQPEGKSVPQGVTNRWEAPTKKALKKGKNYKKSVFLRATKFPKRKKRSKKKKGEISNPAII